MSDELAIARKARVNADEAAELRGENARLVEMLDALRAQMVTLAFKAPVGKSKCHKCISVLVDETRRSVECSYCGSKLDPFDVLHEYATGERRLLQWNAQYKDEHRRLRAEIDAMKGDVAKSRTVRIECPRGCKKFVAVSDSHPHGVTPHACYETRARAGLVPRSADARWRAVAVDSRSQWTNLMTATRTATANEGARVEEYTKPIGEKAERAANRVEHERQWREQIARGGR